MAHTHAHVAAAATVGPVCCAVITVSDTRSEARDTGGQFIMAQLREANFRLQSYRIIPDTIKLIQTAVRETAAKADVALLTGGTGISKRDNTYEAVTALYEKEVVGFGELFRVLSFEEIGAAAMLSRASAGIYQDTVIFSMPGSVPALRLAMERLVLPEIRHLVSEVRKHGT